jgi:hypothetical protein
MPRYEAGCHCPARGQLNLGAFSAANDGEAKQKARQLTAAVGERTKSDYRLNYLRRIVQEKEVREIGLT